MKAEEVQPSTLEKCKTDVSSGLGMRLDSGLGMRLDCDLGMRLDNGPV